MQQHTNALLPSLVHMLCLGDCLSGLGRAVLLPNVFCAHSLSASYIMYPNVAKTHSFHSASMCHLPGRNIQSRPGSSLLGLMNHPSSKEMQQMNATKKAKAKPFLGSRTRAAPFITRLHVSNLSFLISGGFKLMFSQGNSTRVFSISMHPVASH